MIRINLVSFLGNEMYQYTFCRVLSERIGSKFYVGKGKNYHFGNNEDKRIFKYFDIEQGEIDGDIVNNFYQEVNGKSIIKGKTNKVFNPGLAKMTFSNTKDYKNKIYEIVDSIEDFTLLNGFFGNPVFFDEKYDDIRGWFKFKNEYNHILDKYDVDEYCYIHFRGGDIWLNNPNSENCLTEEYYSNAIKQFNMNKYVIVTDNKERASEHFKWMERDGLEYHIIKTDNTKNYDSIADQERSNYIVDFYTLTRAKYFIGSHSTFAEWAGFLNIHRHKMIFPYSIRQEDKTFYPVHFFTYLSRNKENDKIEIFNI